LLLVAVCGAMGIGCATVAEPFPAEVPPTRLAAITEVSGLVWHPGRKLFFAVSDRGSLHSIDVAGREQSIWKGFDDAEGVTYGRSDGSRVYVLRERPTIAILEFDVDAEAFRRTFELGRWIRPQDPNKGAEGITFVPDDKGGAFYVGVQDGTIHVFRLPPGDDVTDVVRLETFRPHEEREDIAGLDFDRVNRLLYVLWDRPNRLAVLDGRRILADWEMYLDASPNQEGIAVDVERGQLFSVEDDNGQIYRYSGFEPRRAPATDAAGRE
jgi:uncharacterized protein YjiK